MKSLDTIRGLFASLSSALHPPLTRALDAGATRVETPAGGLFVYEDTRGEGAPVVLVHSVNAAASSYEMRPIFEALRGKRPVLAFDLPGFGLSERGPRRYDRALYRDAILAMIERAHTHRGIPADVVALSLGCEFAATAALSRPERVRSLTLISPTGFGRPRETPQRAAAEGRAGTLERTLETPIVGAPLYSLIASRPSIRYFLSKSFVGPVDRGLERYAWVSAHQPGARHAPLAFLSGVLFDPRIRADVYERLACPVQVIHDEDAYTDFSRLPELAARSGWTVTRIAPTRGLPQWDEPKRTAAAMLAFWAPMDREEARMTEASSYERGY